MYYHFLIWTVATTTTPMCEMSEGMTSPKTIQSSEIKINDQMADIELLRPNSASPMQSSKPTLVIEYTPTVAKPIALVKLVSTENIKTYNVTFTNEDGTVINRWASINNTIIE